jgi:hypothetical protein
MSTATLEQASRFKLPADAPTPILFPLDPGNPCLYWPHGKRDGDPAVALMTRRDNHAMIDLLELRPGECYSHRSVRHADDPIFRTNPNAARLTGVWDYCCGLAYEFFVPGRAEPYNDIPREVVAVILHMANLDFSPSKIAGTLAISGLKAEKIVEILTAYET